MKRIALLLAAAVCMVPSALGQNTPPSREFFRLDFLLKEMESGKLVNTRAFQTMASTDDPGLSSVRSGDKVAIQTGGSSGLTYLDVGVSLDVQRLRRSNEELSLNVIAEVTNADNGTNIIRQAKWSSVVVIPLRKPTVIFSSDGPTGKRQLQLEITATPVH